MSAPGGAGSAAGELLFVYGTLRRGDAAPARAALDEGGRPLGLAAMDGSLWDLGPCPGMTEAEGPDDRVVGELYALECAGSVLRTLDAYERHDPVAGPGCFERVRRKARTEDGEAVEAWVYLWRGPTGSAERIPSGDWSPGRTPGLILVRHSLPTVDPGHPASHWRLSEEGRARAVALAGALGARRPAAVVTSREPKARQTAALLARALALPCRVEPGLEEHHRETVPFLGGPEELGLRVRRLFAAPGERVFGEETGEAARARFAAAVRRVLRAHHLTTVAVVTHGTVLSLFVAGRAGLDPARLWERLEMPSFVALSRPGLRPVGGVVRVDGTEAAWREAGGGSPPARGRTGARPAGPT